MLIVDPNPDVLQSTAMLVEHLGYPVVRLSDATDALEAIERERPGLVLQEVRVPGLNISGLLAAVRSNPQTAHIPIVFFSGSLELPALAARHQAWGFLAKPFTFQQLARLLERALGPPPNRMQEPGADEVEREVRNAFREYRDLLGAVNSYVMLLERTEQLSPAAKATVERLEDLILMLEARTDRLRAYILALLGPVDQVDPVGAEPDGRGGRKPSGRPERPPRARPARQA